MDVKHAVGRGDSAPVARQVEKYCADWGPGAVVYTRGDRLGQALAATSMLPLVLVVLTTLFLLVTCFVVQHIRNLCAGKYGLGAIPLYDFFMKKWRNAPTFEPVYATRPGIY